MATHSSILPRESRGQRILVGCCLWVSQSRTRLKQLSSDSSSLISMCLHVFLLGFILYENLCVSWTCLTVSFSMLDKFQKFSQTLCFSLLLLGLLQFKYWCQVYRNMDCLSHWNKTLVAGNQKASLASLFLCSSTHSGLRGLPGLASFSLVWCISHIEGLLFPPPPSHQLESYSLDCHIRHLNGLVGVLLCS